MLISIQTTAQSLLNVGDSSKLEHYASTGVRSVTVKTRLYTNKKPDYFNTKLKLILNERGLIDTFQHYAGNDIKYYKVYQYNSHNNIITELTLKPDKDTARYQINRYDSEQNLNSRITYNYKEEQIFRETFAYNQRHDLIHHLKVNHKQDSSEYRIKYQYNSDGSISLKSRQDEQKQDITNWYYNYLDSGKTVLIKTDHAIFGQIPISGKTVDENGNLIQESFYNQEGKLVTEHFYKYKKGKLIQEQIFDSQSETEFIINRRFNRKNLLKEEIAKYKFDDKPSHHYKLKYNCKGLVKKETIHPGNNKPSKVIKSVYDKQHNCIKETHYQDQEILREVHYQIEYFPKN